MLSCLLFSTRQPQHNTLENSASLRSAECAAPCECFGDADVSAYLISLITGAPTSQCNSATQGASVLLVLTDTPCWWKCFTKSHKSYRGSVSDKQRYQSRARARRKSRMHSVSHDPEATNTNYIEGGCLFYSMRWEISVCSPHCYPGSKA